LENSWKRHQETAEFAWSELEKIGFELLVEKNDRLYPLTTVVLPEVIRENEANIRRALLDDYGIEVGGGLGELSGKIWRIGLMGYNAKAKNVLTLVGAIKKVGGL
jgi:alanine-glyoxylate transaminase/serine-glyoxylate transaminase/serine-pyruvate transaminase